VSANQLESDMQDDGSSLNDTERMVRDILKAKLGNRARITRLKQDGDHISIEVVSQNDFPWTSNALHEVADEIVEATKTTIDVHLTTTWPSKLKKAGLDLDAAIQNDLQQAMDIAKKIT
jgi:hypothetical protein